MIALALYCTITCFIYYFALAIEQGRYGGWKKEVDMLLLSLLGFIAVPLFIILQITEGATKPSQTINRALTIMWGEQ